MFAPRAQQCRVYARADATVVAAAPQFSERLGPRPYPADLGKLVLRALKASRGALETDEPAIVCTTSEGKLFLDGQPAESDPRLLGERLLELFARPAEGQVEAQPPRGLGPRAAWLAAACPPEELMPAMGLRRVRPCTWEDGLAGTSVFVTPPVRGYTLATGLPYPDLETEVISDPLLLFLESLSQKARRVGYFAVDPGCALYAWALAEEGTIVRAYAHSGELGHTLWRLGLRSEAEPEFFDEADEESEEPGYWQRADLTYPEARHVIEMARFWTVDPSTFEGEPSSGWAGELSL